MSNQSQNQRAVEKEFTLPKSGKKVVIFEAYGDDLERASRMVDMAKEGQMRLMFALIACVCEFDGHRIALEDVGRLPMADVLELLGQVNGGMGKSLPVSTSPN